MDEPPVRAIGSVTRYVNRVAEDVAADAIEDHEARCHIPPPRRGKLTAIPFPNRTMNDSQIARAWEMLELGATEQEVCLALDVPTSVLERCLAEYKPAWRQFLAEREAGL